MDFIFFQWAQPPVDVLPLLVISQSLYSHKICLVFICFIANRLQKPRHHELSVPRCFSLNIPHQKKTWWPTATHHLPIIFLISFQFPIILLWIYSSVNLWGFDPWGLQQVQLLWDDDFRSRLLYSYGWGAPGQITLAWRGSDGTTVSLWLLLLLLHNLSY